MMKETITKHRKWLACATLAAPLLAAGCYLALEDRTGRSSTDATSESVQSTSQTDGEAITRAEWNARVMAMKDIREQRPETQRRYHETWIAATHRVLEQQRSVLVQFEARLAENTLSNDERAALEKRVAQLRDAASASAQRLEEHTSAVTTLR